jgi:glycosyltransferase involved in cell wall biosynthesis
MNSYPATIYYLVVCLIRYWLRMRRITIGIPSFNEEKNIADLLMALSNVKSDDFTISEVIISDDSSDNTSRAVQIFATQKLDWGIKFIHYTKRRGAAAAWNEIFENSIGDIIVLYDADIVLDKYSTKELVSSINGKVALCASNPTPILVKDMPGRASIFISHWLRSLRNKKLSKYTVMGRSFAIRSDLAKKIKIPKDMIAIDLFVQCEVLRRGFEIVYNDNAIVYFLPPNNIIDFASQVMRSLYGHKQLDCCVEQLNLSPSPKIMLTATLRTALLDPIGAMYAMICMAFVPYYRRRVHDLDKAQWYIADSTKAPYKGISKSEIKD